MRVALLDDYQGVAMKMADWSRLEGRAEVVAFPNHIIDIDTLVRALESFDCIMLMRERTKFPRALIERLPKLKLLITAAMWNASVDSDAATEYGIQFSGTRDLSHAAAELALGMMIGLVRHLPAEDHAMRQGKWQTTVGLSLHGKTLGIVGLGVLGKQMVPFARVLGMHGIAWSENLTPAKAEEVGATYVSREQLFSEADIISIHLKLSPRTRGLIGAGDLARMKPTAYIINTARGPIIEEQSLLTVLRERKIAGAALDVYDVEPLPLDHPFRSLDNVMLVPHLGYVTEENYRLIYGDTLENVEAFLEGRLVRPLNTPRPRR
jgi:phosphoglycerate dehydrogenase-like enzyme